jgi:hypothetical protein
MHPRPSFETHRFAMLLRTRSRMWIRYTTTLSRFAARVIPV